MKTIEVKVKQGIVRGFEDVTALSKKQQFCFLGIPYAAPPIGNLRFQAPKPVEKWEGILDATKEGNSCVQIEFIENAELIGEEDCLYLNVFTPQLPAEGKGAKAVMVFIHGGAFHFGNGNRDKFSPDYLLEHDVIVVTINYRLSVLGFLNLGLPDCPGNVGLKDQILALKWIRENISEFGGNPDNVTAFGESAGAGSVHILAVSPLAKGLFKRCILQSGFIFNPWGVVDDTTQHAFTLGRLCGYDGNDRRELLKVLKNASATDLIQMTSNIHMGGYVTYPSKVLHFPFLPSVEFIKEGACIPDKPDVLMELADPIPMIAGVNNLEGLIAYLYSSPGFIDAISEDFNSFVRVNIPIKREENIQDISNELKECYFKGKTIGKDTFLEITDLLSDFCFINGLHGTVSAISKLQSSEKFYVYYFTYDGSLNLVKPLTYKCLPGPLERKGACHADELFYLFYPKGAPEIPYKPNDRKVIEEMCTFWTNFAKFGNPNGMALPVKWEPMTLENPRYLEINKEPKMQSGIMNEDRIKLWKMITSLS